MTIEEIKSLLDQLKRFNVKFNHYIELNEHEDGQFIKCSDLDMLITNIEKKNMINEELNEELLKEEIFHFISKHECIVTNDVKKKDRYKKVKFTTFGNIVAGDAIYDIIQLLDDDMKLKVVEMMRKKQVR
jgi:hypothetical protein